MTEITARSRWTWGAAFLLAALIGLAVRLPQLGARPMHTDEAVNAYIVGQLLAGEAFTYDPRDRHGPALAAVTLPLVRMQGAQTFSGLTESELRLTPVLAGTVTILLFGRAVPLFGLIPCLVAALLFAGSSLPVYYDRYFIHEPLFCAATFGLILSAWRVLQKNSVGQATLAGACAALMLASKETAVLHFFALAAAGFVFWTWDLRRKVFRGSLRPTTVLAVAGTFMLLCVILFTWFGRNWKALEALLQAVPDSMARAGGEGHQEPFWYFGKLLSGGWSGGMLLAFAGVGVFLTVRKRHPRPFGFLAYYAGFLALIYGLIPYKTPWLALNLWLPTALFAGRAVESLGRATAKYLPPRVVFGVVTILGTLAAVLIAHDTWQRVFVHPADEANPYAYAQTSEDLLGLPTEIGQMARANGIEKPRIAVIAADPWPLPWYLRHFSEVGFWQPGQQTGEADFYITSTGVAEEYGDRLHKFRPDFFGVRPGVLILLWLPAPR